MHSGNQAGFLLILALFISNQVGANPNPSEVARPVHENAAVSPVPTKLPWPVEFTALEEAGKVYVHAKNAAEKLKAAKLFKDALAKLYKNTPYRIGGFKNLVQLTDKDVEKILARKLVPRAAKTALNLKEVALGLHLCAAALGLDLHHSVDNPHAHEDKEIAIVIKKSCDEDEKD